MIWICFYWIIFDQLYLFPLLLHYFSVFRFVCSFCCVFSLFFVFRRLSCGRVYVSGRQVCWSQWTRLHVCVRQKAWSELAADSFCFFFILFFSLFQCPNPTPDCPPVELNCDPANGEYAAFPPCGCPRCEKCKKKRKNLLKRRFYSATCPMKTCDDGTQVQMMGNNCEFSFCPVRF